MAVNIEAYRNLTEELKPFHAKLIAVSKTKPANDIQALYNAGQRDFGENYVQEMLEKASQLPSDIQWHFIGHLQSNKVKSILKTTSLIHGVDSLKLLNTINTEAGKLEIKTDVLLQVHIAEEETKFGFDKSEILELIPEFSSLENIRISGLMGMATFTEDMTQVKKEFNCLHELFNQLKTNLNKDYFTELSMGMTQDYKVALECGSTMIRIGSAIFGSRN